MKKYFYLTLLLWVITSCYPSRLVYVIEDTLPLENKDSIDVQLLKGSTISLDAINLRTMLSLEICNRSNSTLFLKDKNRLEVVVDTTTLNYELVESDSLPYTLGPRSKNKIFLMFATKDTDYLVYKSVGQKNEHSLRLFLDFQNDSGKEFEKQVILKFSKTRSFVIEEEN